MDNRSFLNVLVRGMALLKKLQRPTLWIYLSLNWHIRHHADPSYKLEMVQHGAARFVKGRYEMFESVMQMLEQLTWTPLSKRRKNSRL